MNEDKTPLSIQIAFQGGGAKLCALIAAAEALQQAARDKRIRITRLAGTSAGSIVACLLAAQIPMESVRKSLQGHEGRKLANYYSVPGRLAALRRVLFGKPIRDPEPLRTWVQSMLKNSKVLHVKDFKDHHKTPVLIVSTDLSSRKPIVAHENTDAIAAILDSCAIPLFLRMWNKQGTSIVDGGISENLPTDFLEHDRHSYGPVVAVSFAPRRSENPANLGDFAAAVLDSAISSVESKSRSALPPYAVMSIETNLSTLDFKRAFEGGLGDSYDLVKERALQWIDQYLRQRKSAEAQRVVDPWREENPTAQFLMRQIGEVYLSQEHYRPLKYHRCQFRVYANSLRDIDDNMANLPDLAEFELEFSTGESQMNAILVGLMEPHPSSSFAQQTAFHSVKDANRKKLKTISVPMRTDPRSEDRDLGVFFAPPLAPNSGPYCLEFQEYGTNLLEPLVKQGRDELVYFPRRANGSVGRVELVLYVPERSSVRLVEKSGRSIATVDHSRPMSIEDLSGHNKFPGLKALGWIAENVHPPGDGQEPWGVDVLAA